MSAIAISDHGNLGGWLEFYLECKKIEIKPILSIETYITMDPDNLPKENRTRDNFHMILTAMDEEGYKNLLWLSSNAYINNFYYRPRIFLDHLITRSRGLLGQSACLAGVLCRSATYDEINKVYWDEHHNSEHAVGMFKEIFHGNYYLELMDNPFDQQIAYNKFLIDLAKKTDSKLIISADSHYTKKDDYELHSLLMAMQTKQTLTQYHENSKFHYGPWYYIKSPQEMLDSAKKLDVEQAFHNSLEIASKCDINLKLGEYRMPKFKIQDDPDYEDFIKNETTR